MILIRHAAKAYDNGKGPAGSPLLDPDILDGEEEKIVALAQRLVAQKGRPTKIICSPFLRTRRTAQIMADELKVPFESERMLGEFLANQKRKLESSTLSDLNLFCEETAQSRPIWDRSFPAFNRRVRRYKMKEGIWYVTHRIFILCATGIRDADIAPLAVFFGGSSDSERKVSVGKSSPALQESKLQSRKSTWRGRSNMINLLLQKNGLATALLQPIEHHGEAGRKQDPLLSQGTQEDPKELEKK